MFSRRQKHAAFKDFSAGTAKMTTVLTSDGIIFNFNSKLKKDCKMVSMILEDCEDHGIIPLSNVNSDVMKRIVFFNTSGHLEHHDDMINLMLACDYLNYDELLDYAARIVADSLKGKSASEIRSFLGVAG
ncbi:hypothetical protein [Yellowstone lake phycodnavirus 2]|uniref:hypothetical protein n=1 Tax=Yellowstone lake phycodnavirus 2 TaxID=1586714 RepID=UPI0006EBCA1B|nr:hypothetical protein AR678_gp135 [Yellowstone lake phycodnavirus 2]BAT22409.1 hypothetical protein [Yellowstone lake phycodnavirus 2]